MSDGIFCKYCHHHWKVRRDYDRHITCCEYFYHQRRNPLPEMDEHGIRIPSMREMFRLVQDLSYRLEKTEKEVDRLKALLKARQKKAIIEWLNQPSQTPDISFESWWHKIKAQETDVVKVIKRDLTEGIISCLKAHIESFTGKMRPIRCFVQKPNTFYVYSIDTGNPNATNPKPIWRIMDKEQVEKMMIHVSQSILREFLVWQKTQENNASQLNEYDEHRMDKTVDFMMKINGNGVAIEKRLLDVKKWLFSQLEENLRVIMDCEFE